MASDYYKLVSTTNRHTDWTTEVVLARDEKTGEPTSVVRAGEPTKLSAEDRKKLEALGYKFEQSSKSEADEVAEVRASTAGTDTTGTGPVFSDSSVDQDNNK
jgi:hypothetical protein